MQDKGEAGKEQVTDHRQVTTSTVNISQVFFDISSLSRESCLDMSPTSVLSYLTSYHPSTPQIVYIHFKWRHVVLPSNQTWLTETPVSDIRELGRLLVGINPKRYVESKWQSRRIVVKVMRDFQMSDIVQLAKMTEKWHIFMSKIRGSLLTRTNWKNYYKYY